MALISERIGKCEVCKPDTDEPLFRLTWPTEKDQIVCGWCAERARQFLQTSSHDEAINIFWGAGKICYPEMKFMSKFIKENNILSIADYGTGLSTECLSLFVDDITTFDEFPKHLNFYRRLNHMKAFVKYVDYDSTAPNPKDRPELPDMGRMYDLAFVDGGQERSREVRHAMKHASRYIYLADPNMGEQSFFPTPEWKLIWGDKRLWQRL